MSPRGFVATGKILRCTFANCKLYGSGGRWVVVGGMDVIRRIEPTLLVVGGFVSQANLQVVRL